MRGDEPLNRQQDFLETIIDSKRARLAREMSARPLASVREAAQVIRASAPSHALRAALTDGTRLNVIAEIKRASPSKGEIRSDADPIGIAREYAANGAAAISVLTEEDYFKGSLDDLRAVKAAVAVPVLRKDFIFDEWQVYETAEAGAEALLLIVAALADEELANLRQLTEEKLGMDALVEVHDVEELRRAVHCGANLVGVNNRNLRTFAVSLDVSREISRHAPADVLLISESGLRTHDDLRGLRARGFTGFLIGETLMRAEQPGAALREMIAGGSE
ncbi:MAG: indole-3-glycerol phosphate synthase TrpC [Acidobacteriota bacterium]|nr:indole-3-glycerol phosphate synthase TrpC [Acidobacteriota bacterium]